MYRVSVKEKNNKTIEKTELLSHAHRQSEHESATLLRIFAAKLFRARNNGSLKLAETVSSGFDIALAHSAPLIAKIFVWLVGVDVYVYFMSMDSI